MKYIKLFITVCATVLATFSFAETKNENGYEISLKTAKETAQYRCGEKAEFVLSVKKDGKPASGIKLSGNISKDSVAPRKNIVGTTDKNGKFKTSWTLDEPGFLKCQIFVPLPPVGEKKAKNVEMLAGAGFEPLKIKPSLPVPEDFDKFWNEQKKILKNIPLNIKTTRVKTGRKDVELFDVQADTFNGKLSAYVTMPKGAKNKSLPLVLLPQGAGVYSSSPSFEWAQKGFIAMSFNVHGIPNGQKAEFYANLAKNELRGYATKNSDSRETIFFRTAYMRVMRAMDVAMTFPQWDGKNLVLYGGSQGAGQTIAGAALYNDKVTLAVAKYPALCDHSGIAVGRTTGWPHFVKTKDGQGNFNKNRMEAARYIDAMNMATRIKCPVICTIHFTDDVCEPTSCYAMFNNIKSDKRLYTYPEARHPAPKEENELMFKLICEKVESDKKSQIGQN